MKNSFLFVCFAFLLLSGIKSFGAVGGPGGGSYTFNSSYFTVTGSAITLNPNPIFDSITVNTNMAIGESPIAGRTMTIRRDNLTTLPVDGLFLTNATPATVGVQVQYSPAIYQSGGAWLTGSVSNAPVSFRSYVVPAPGATIPTSTWKMDSSLNGGAFITPLSLTDIGNLSVLANITAGGVVSAGAASYLGFTGRSYFSSSVNGAIELSNQAITSRATLQANTPQITKTANYTIAAALDSGLRFNNIGSVIATTNTLPTAVAAQHYWQNIDAAQIVSVKASGSDVIRWGSTVSAAAGDIWSSQVGSSLHLYSPKAGLWVVDHAVGGWTLVAPRSGNLTLIGGTLTVANTTVTANSALFLTRKTSGGTIGFAVNYTLSTATSFTVTSDNVLDTSVYSWKLEEIPN